MLSRDGAAGPLLRAAAAAALGAGPGDVVSLVGAGGKTSLLYRLLAELRGAGAEAAAATTTRIAVPGAGEPELLCAETWEELRRLLPAGRPAVLGRRLLPGGKVEGIPPEWCDRIAAEGLAGALVVEADGASRRPVKAPEAWEPVVPSSTTLFVAVAGLSCLGAPLDGEHAFRPERIAAVAGLPPGAPITGGGLARLLGSEEGLLRGRPPRARAAAFLNQADGPEAAAAGAAIARELLGGPHPPYERVVVASLRERPRALEVYLSRAAPGPGPAVTPPGAAC